jgi:putative ABC transport system permease protein
VSPIADFPGEISTKDTSGLLINTLVVEPSYFRLAGLLPTIGKVIGESQGIVVSSQTLVALGLSSDESSLEKIFNIKIYYPDDETNTVEETISALPTPLQGIISDDSMTPTAIVYSSLFTKEPPFYRKALVKAKSVEVLERLRDKLIADGFLVSARIDLVTQARKITNIITIILGVFGVTALVVSAIGMFNTMLVGFLERIYEVGILKSLGATDYDVRNLFLVEASIMGLLGGAGGVIIGFGLGKLFNFLLSFIAMRFGGKSFDLFATPLWFVLVIMVFSAFIGFISGWWPAHRAAGLSPKEAFTKR